MSAHEDELLKRLSEKHIKALKTESPKTDFMAEVMLKVTHKPVDTSVFVYKSPITTPVWAAIALAFIALVLYVIKGQISIVALEKYLPRNIELSLFDKFSFVESSQLPFVVVSVAVIFTLLTLLEIPMMKKLVNHNR
ncbi:hypothetical protein ACH3PA_12450 [Leeuwenhoekiella sp. A2]|uniref:hypothetical protein n=1 Tax=Leeuwenhoekiella sp. A2 TaxID=3141460 RepID=UPI003A80C449